MNDEKKISDEFKMVSSEDLKAVEKRAAKTTEESEENPYKIEFKKPVVWEGATYTEIDLSGLEDLCSRDMIMAQRALTRAGNTSLIPELDMEYACIMASKATDMPVEFFFDLPCGEATKVKNRVSNFFYKED